MVYSLHTACTPSMIVCVFECALKTIRKSAAGTHCLVSAALNSLWGAVCAEDECSNKVVSENKRHFESEFDRILCWQIQFLCT